MNEQTKKVVIELQHVKRDFQVGEETVHALRDVSFKIYEGEFVTIMGKSGSGKSTLLNQLGCLDTPTSGEYYLDGVSVRKALFGHKNVDNNVFKAEMNRLSKDNPSYSDRTVEFKLLDLFDKAAHKIFTERYENIN